MVDDRARAGRRAGEDGQQSGQGEQGGGREDGGGGVGEWVQVELLDGEEDIKAAVERVTREGVDAFEGEDTERIYKLADRESVECQGTGRSEHVL